MTRRINKPLNRKEVRYWFEPIRNALAEIKTGEVDCLRGYPVTRLHKDDDYARLDFCIEGWIGCLKRMLHLNYQPLEVLRKRLAAGAPVTTEEVDQALTLLKKAESLMLKIPRDLIRHAVMTEKIAIELDRIKEAA